MQKQGVKYSSLVLQSVKATLACVALCGSNVAFSHKGQFEELLSLSLKELANVKVAIASRREEPMNFAPGIVTVYTHQEIKAFGGRNLRDILDRMTSMEVATSHVFPHHKLSLRGVNTGFNDTNILVLLNGYPFRNAMGGGSSMALYNGIPLSSIERIEVNRGPGSVLYGTNAFAGSINIVTRTKRLPATPLSVEASYGSFDTRRINVLSQLSDDDYDVMVVGNAQQSDGDKFENVTDSFGNTGIYTNGFKQQMAIASGDIGQLNFMALYTDFEVDNGGGFFKLGDQQLMDEKKYIALGYEAEFNDNWTLHASYLYNDQFRGWQANNPLIVMQSTDSLEQIAELYAKGNVANDIHIILGASRSVLEGGVRHFEPSSFNIWRQSYFSQASWMINPETNLIVGFQWNRPEESDGDLSSRLGLVKQLGDHWWLKLSYGEAFRSPFGTELFVDTPGLKGNRSLTPEEMKTYEAQLIYEDDTKHLAVSIYDSTQSDIITQVVPDSGGTPTYQNRGEVEYHGIELEGKMSLTEKLLLSFNANYQTSETDRGVEDDSFAPNEMIKFGFAYEYSNSVSIAVFNRYMGKSTDLNETRDVPKINKVPDAYNLLTANVRWAVSQDFRLFETGESSLAVYFDNLLNEEVYSPDIFNRGNNNSLPSHNGFNVTVTFGHTF